MSDADIYADLTDDERRLLASVDGLLGAPETWVEASLGVEQSLVDAIHAERRLAGATMSPPTVAPVAPLAPNVVPLRGRRRWGPLTLAALGGAAAAALVAVAVTRSTDDSAPATADAPLAATALGAQATGTVTAAPQRSGVRLHVRADGLPLRTGEEFYELWVKSCAGDRLVPAGTFHDLSDVVGWVGVSIDDFPVVTVTRERVAGPQDPAQGSSGEVVLTAQLGPACPG